MKKSTRSKATHFRKLLKSKKSLLLAGAHDAISAKLIEEAGFDAVWASSFGISASAKCLPDANVLTMTEALEAAKGMNEAVSIPVIADCDNGYGNALNIIRMVKEYERAGMAGVSIEDNPFPKKCSLYPGEKQELVPADEMSGRIHAAKSTQTKDDFFVIARTEALIAGLGIEEALSRAYAYEEAGADAILIHSRLSTPQEIKEFSSQWKGKIPLVAVPTKYPNVSVSELEKIGIKVIIFANQALRASVAAMRETLREMKDKKSISSVSKKISPLDEIFRLVGQPVLEENEKTYVRDFKKAPSAIIVAAGYDKALWPLNSDKPKTMLEIKGKSILERQSEVLRRSRIDKIAVVGGYKQEKIRIPGIHHYRNDRFDETHILYSLFCAEAEMEDKFLFMYGDVLFHDEILERLLKSKGDINLVVDRSPRPPLQKTSGLSKDEYEFFASADSAPRNSLRRTNSFEVRLRRTKKNQQDTSVLPEGLHADAFDRDWVVVGSSGDLVTAIGQKINPSKANGEFIGLALFSKRGAKALRKTYHQLLNRNGQRPFHNAPSFEKAQFTDMIQELIRRGEKVNAVNVHHGWVDIDTFADYKRAWQEVKS